LLSRFDWFRQIFEPAHEDSVFVIAKEKIDSVAAGESAGIAVAGGGRCQIDIVPRPVSVS
jgi:hypothetical protein